MQWTEYISLDFFLHVGLVWKKSYYLQGCWNAILEYANDKAIYVIAVGVAIGVVEVCKVYLFWRESIDIYWIKKYFSNDIFISHVDFKNKLSSNVFVVEILSSENCLLKSWNYLFFPFAFFLILTFTFFLFGLKVLCIVVAACLIQAIRKSDDEAAE